MASLMSPNSTQTALKRYQRLEARGLWRELPEAQRREVVVNFGQSSIVLTDPRSDTPLAHWSLPAVQRLNPGQMPALFSPGADATETLELSDDEMIGALETVHGAIMAAQARPGRLRGVMMGGTLLALLAVAALFLPGAVTRHAAGIVPAGARAEIGLLAQTDLARLTGAPCTGPDGLAALSRLSARLFAGESPVTLVVVREGLAGALHLPGRRVILSQALLAEAEGPEVMAGHVLAERARAEARDPLAAVLRHAGLMASLRLLATGGLPPDAVKGYGEVLLRRPRPPCRPAC